MPEKTGPLLGVKVLDLSTIVAGGTATSLLADFGAEVVKVERPDGGDPLRNWGPFFASAHQGGTSDKHGTQPPGPDEQPEGVSLWWKVHSRNKKSVTLDLRCAEGQLILKEMVAKADLLVEGFRPGTLERWGLGPEVLAQVNPRLVLVRCSGFGQTGPYKDRPGFGTIAECMSGMVGMTGFPGGPPVLPPIPMADEVAGTFGAMAALMALYHRDSLGGNLGQVIDLSLLEPLFRLSVPHVTIYDLLGIVRQQVGNDFPDAAPRTLYQTADGRWVGLSATSQNTWEALVRAIDMPSLADDPRYKDNAARVENREQINEVLQGWIGSRSLEEVMAQLIPAGGVVGPVYDIAQIMDDPHFKARDDIVEIEDPDLGRTKMVGVVPKFSRTPGSITHGGPRLGEHNGEVYSSWLGYNEKKLQNLADEGVI